MNKLIIGLLAVTLIGCKPSQEALVRDALPKVVKMHMTEQAENPETHEKELFEATCSGVFISPSGHILSARHCVEGENYKAIEVEVETINGDMYKADILNIDPRNDLSLLKIYPLNDKPVPYVRLSDKVTVGEDVYEIGMPIGLPWVVTNGIVSIADLKDEDRHFIVFNAVTNPGNSGGLLMNSRGELIGIAVAGLIRPELFGLVAIPTGLNLAEPISNVRRLLERFSGLPQIPVRKPLKRRQERRYRLGDTR